MRALKIKINILFLAFLLIITVFSSCSTDELKSNTTNSEPNVKLSKVDTSLIAKDTLSQKFVPRLEARELLENFIYCQDNAESELMCKFYISKAICDYYGINDLKKGEIYLDFENIYASINKNQDWENLGEATDQKNLEKAQLLANRGKATIAIDTRNKYGHVVMVIKGNLSIAHNWKGLMAPNVASFFMLKKLKPFINKSMGYAYASPEGVYLYSKK